jgi:hypothetical protein
MKNKFKVGDKVKYIKPTLDHNLGGHSLKIDNIYTIKDYITTNAGNAYLLKEANWWAKENCLVSITELSKADEKYAPVILKIRQLNEKFNNRKKESHPF